MRATLILAGVLDLVAAALHLGCIAGGAPWYRFFGAGERMARMAEAGAITPTLITIGIAAVLSVWAAYCFSAAGLIPRLPLTQLALVAISLIYLTRAAAAPVMAATMTDRGPTFIWVSSAIVLVFGVVHAAGAVMLWSAAPRA